MKNMELLAPAGNMQSLKAAVYNGANAVYLGIKEFNARNNIEGFNLDTLREAVEFAHLFGVKVYLALNILFKDEELQSALDVVADANNMGVDAFIVQDLGLVHLIKSFYPNIELHASTQMAVHNLEGVKVLEKLGFSRVVLARETSGAEIERIHKNSNIEIEFFVQGALCVSFSGNCYMCSHLVGKSGNRGVCQQFCRLPYTFDCDKIRKSGYLLSAKDICMLDNLDELKKLGVSSLKIEGRARRPFYVAQACKIYRQILDNGKYSKRDFDVLNMAFNRGYTPAYFNGNGNIISNIQGNNGLEIGVVNRVNNGKKFNEVFISSTYNLTGKCGLKFVYNGKEVASIGVYDVKRLGNEYRITTTANIKSKSRVYIIQDEELEEKVLSESKKLGVNVKFNATQNQPIKMVVEHDGITVCQIGETCQKAKTIAVNNEQVLKQLSRSELFEIKEFECTLDGCYILNSSINKIRNAAYEELKQKLIHKYQKQIVSKVIVPDMSCGKAEPQVFDFEIVDDIGKLNKQQAHKHVIYDYQTLNADTICLFDRFCQETKVKGYIDIPNFATEQDIKTIIRALQGTRLGVVANNIYALQFDCDIIGGQFLNVYNSYTIRALNQIHKLDAIFVEELQEREVEHLKSCVPVIRREKVYMTLLHCPFKQNTGCDCASCAYSPNATFTINSGKRFKIKRKKTSSCVFSIKD